MLRSIWWDVWELEMTKWGERMIELYIKWVDKIEVDLSKNYRKWIGYLFFVSDEWMNDRQSCWII